MMKTPTFTIDAAVVAPRLDLSPQRFVALWRRGLIRQRIEQGVGEDEGRFRVTLRYLAASAVLVVNAEGGILVDDGPRQEK